ncbi:hypothetical protein ACWDBD_35085 [Streptomyces sp. NPDC001118]|uniref:hypothetical protein n=1 Tax=unclassified Streptomyces TaxID=2593676 RepID=UPI00332256F1
MTTVDVPLEKTTHELAAALDDCHDQAAPGDVVVSPRGWVIASAARVADGAVVPGGWAELHAARRETPSPARQQALFADGLLRLQRQTLHRLLDAVVRRLEERTADGANLLNRQLVRGAVADVALALSEADDLSDQPGETRRRWLIHQDLVAAGRTLIKLYGASGFTAEGPGHLVHLLELLGNTYLHPGEGGVGDG